MPDLKSEVVRELKARDSDEWREIAAAVPKVSFSMVYQLATGKYKSAPTYDRLAGIDAWLKKHPRNGKRVAA